MNWKKPSCAVLFIAVLSAFSIETFAQVMQRPRIVQSTTSSQTATTTVATSTIASQPSQTSLSRAIPVQRPALTNRIDIADSYKQQSLVKKTAMSTPANLAA